jgi:hypothetical protein
VIHPRGSVSDTFERDLQIAMDVVVESLQRRDIQDTNAAFELWLTPEVIQTSQERGECFARTRGRGRLAEGGAEPRSDGGRNRSRVVVFMGVL